MESNYHILLVDDEPLSSRVYAYMIKESELGTSTLCTDSRLAMGMLRKGNFDLVVLDLNMPHISGKELLELVALEFPDVPVLILTNEDKVETAVECMKRGAFDFMSKPIDRNRFLSALRHALTIRELKRELTILSSRREELPLEKPELFGHIITASSAMRTIFAYIEAIAPSPKAVLITGESGTGKELIARAIHAASSRSGDFIPINVSGLDDTIFSDSLFGHLKGAYTGAEGIRKGLVEQAKEGTLFLDEIGDLATGPQIKLLRLLQEGEYYPLGADKPMKSHARIITATNADILEGQEQGTFRKDLYYRLIAHRIQLPPLRERAEDIPVLLEHFCRDAAETFKKEAPVIGQDVLTALEGYRFPGNIRELQSMCFDVVSRSPTRRLDPGLFESLMDNRPAPKNIPVGGRDNTSILDELEPLDMAPPPPPPVQELAGEMPVPVGTAIGHDGADATGPQNLEEFFGIHGIPKLGEVEDVLYSLALRKCEGSQTLAARVLGVSQSTLSRWIKKNSS